MTRSPTCLLVAAMATSAAARTFVPGVTSEAMARREQFAQTSPMKLSSVAIPDDFDSETKWPECAKVIGDIRDQSNCGCCWAFAAASAASDRLCIATKGKVAVALSAQETCFCAQDDGCDGGQLDEAWEYIQQNGLATGGQYNNTGPFGQEGLCAAFSLPHCHHHGPVGQDPFPAEGTKGCPQVQESPQCPSQCDAGAKSPYSNFDKDRYTDRKSVV